MPINQYRIIRDLMANIDRDNAIVTHDSGSPREQLLPMWETTVPDSYIGWGKSTQLGYSLAVIMGAKLAAPDKLCINVMGDAAIGMTGMDLETAARAGIAILTIVLNNGIMAAEREVLIVSDERYGAMTVGGNVGRPGGAGGDAGGVRPGAGAGDRGDRGGRALPDRVHRQGGAEFFAVLRGGVSRETLDEAVASSGVRRTPGRPLFGDSRAATLRGHRPAASPGDGRQFAARPHLVVTPDLFRGPELQAPLLHVYSEPRNRSAVTGECSGRPRFPSAMRNKALES